MSPPTASLNAPRLVLASTSQYRRMLLDRLGVLFTVAAPGIDESAQSGELPLDLVHRLARRKAEAVAQHHLRSVVVGSDQLAVCGTQVLGKPGSAERCVEQLRAVSGQRVVFHTAVHVINSESGSNEAHVDATTAHFRTLSGDEIQRYVAKEKPFDCAGGFKVEALGVTLLDRIDSQDPTALIGLPLIWLAGALRRLGFELP